MKNNVKRLISIMLLFALVVGCFAAMPLTANAAEPQTIYLKGTGNGFDMSEWNPIFYVGGAELIDAKYTDVWHLQYSKDFDAVTKMQITFTNGVVFEWDSDDGPTLNNGGNPKGWAIVAPHGWEIDYVDRGNNNVSPSFVTTTESGNIQFNISGFNEGEDPPEERGTISIQKTVDGIAFDFWLSTEYDSDIDELLSGITFTIHETTGDQSGVVTFGTDVTGKLEGGFITFDVDAMIAKSSRGALGGWYVVTETLEGVAAKIFETPADYYFNYGGKNIYGNVDSFDYDAKYTIINGYTRGQFDWGYGTDGIGHPRLNGGGHIFYIGITNADPNSDFEGIIYDSFCAEGGARAFAGESDLDCTGYVVPERTQFATYDAMLSAYNYIFDKYGDLNTNRVITQVVTWLILGSIEDIDELDSTNLTLAEKTAIIDVYENSVGYESQQGIDDFRIVDVVYLRCELEHDTHDCQPQLAPIYGYGVRHEFKNTRLTQEYGSLEVSVNAVKTHDEVKLQKVFSQDFWCIFKQDYWDVYTQDFWCTYTQEYKDIFTPVFEKKISTAGDTRVTFVGAPDIDKKSDGGYVISDDGYGDYIDNSNGGFTAVAIPTDGTEREFEISMSGHGNPKFQSNSDKIGLKYTAKVEGDEVVIKFEEKFILGSVAFGLYADVKDIKWSPGQYSYTKGHMTVNGQQEVRIPLSLATATKSSTSNGTPKITTSMSGNTVTLYADGTNIGTVTYVKNGKATFGENGYKIDVEFNGNGVKSTKLTEYPTTQPTNDGSDIPEIVYLTVHCSSLKWYTTGNYEFIDWELFKTKCYDKVPTGKGLADPVFSHEEKADPVFDHVKKVKPVFSHEEKGAKVYVGEGKAKEVYVRTDEICRTEVTDEYDVEFDLLIIRNEDETVIYDGKISNGETIPFYDLPVGDYTVTLSGDDIDTQEEIVTIVADETESIDFDDITVTGEDVVTWLHKKIIKGEKLEDEIRQGKKLADKVKTGEKLGEKVIPGEKLDDETRPGEKLDDVVTKVKLPNKYLGSDNPEDPKSIEHGKYTPERP